MIKKNLVVELTQEDEERLEEIIREICLLIEEEFPPQFQAVKICNKCAYHDLCFV